MINPNIVAAAPYRYVVSKRGWPIAVRNHAGGSPAQNGYASKQDDLKNRLHTVHLLVLLKSKMDLRHSREDITPYYQVERNKRPVLEFPSVPQQTSTSIKTAQASIAKEQHSLIDEDCSVVYGTVGSGFLQEVAKQANLTGL